MTDNKGTNNKPDQQDDLRELRVRRDSPALGTRDAFLELKNALCQHILSSLDPDIDPAQKEQLRPYVHDRLNTLLEERGIVLNRNEKRQLLEAIVTDLMNSRS